MGRRSREILLRLALFLGGLLMALALMEITLRQGPYSKSVLLEPDPYIGQRHVPGGEYDYRGEDFSVRLRFNSLGFHDREHDVAKPPGTFRIVVLGDSFMDGMQVTTEETFAYRLEQELRRRGISAEAVNLGIWGFGTYQELFTLETYGLRFQPDLVVLAFFPNDLTDNFVDPNGTRSNPISYFYRTPSGELRKAEHVPLAAQNPLVGAFRKVFPSVYSWASTVLMSRGSPGEASSYVAFFDNYREDLPRAAEAWNLTLDLLRLVRDRAAGSGAKMFMFLIPNREAVHPEIWQKTQELYPALKNRSLDFGAPNRVLQNFSRANGISYLDLEPGFLDYANRTGSALYFNTSSASGVEFHWNALGHSVAAGFVADRLIREGLVPAGG